MILWLLTAVPIGAPGLPSLGALPLDPACLTTANEESLSKRPSPLDSLSFTVGGAVVKICYGRPSARGRTMIGGYNVPFGRIWRTGANEPTMVHVTGAAVLVGGLRLEPATYSLYTIPGKTEWVVILNRSVEQWGDEGSYEDVKDQELGRARVSPHLLDGHVEQFTIRPEPASGAGVALVLEWEHFRVAIPVRPAE